MTNGASIRSKRNAAVKLMPCQRPCGSRPNRRLLPFSCIAVVLGSGCDFDSDPTMAARPSFNGRIEGQHCQRLSKFRGGEDMVKLACSRLRLLAVELKGRGILAASRQFDRPGIGLAAVRVFLHDARQSHEDHEVEHGPVAGGPILVAMFASVAQDIHAAGRQYTMPVLLRDQGGQAGNDTVSEAVRKRGFASRLESVRMITDQFCHHVFGNCLWARCQVDPNGSELVDNENFDDSTERCIGKRSPPE